MYSPYVWRSEFFTRLFTRNPVEGYLTESKPSPIFNCLLLGRSMSDSKDFTFTSNPHSQIQDPKFCLRKKSFLGQWKTFNVLFWKIKPFGERENVFCGSLTNPLWVWTHYFCLVWPRQVFYETTTTKPGSCDTWTRYPHSKPYPIPIPLFFRWVSQETVSTFVERNCEKLKERVCQDCTGKS